MSDRNFLDGVAFFDVIGPTCCIGVIGFEKGRLAHLGYSGGTSPLDALVDGITKSEAECRAFCAVRGWRLEPKELQTSGITYTLSTGEVL